MHRPTLKKKMIKPKWKLDLLLKSLKIRGKLICAIIATTPPSRGTFSLVIWNLIQKIVPTNVVYVSEGLKPWHPCKIM